MMLGTLVLLWLQDNITAIIPELVVHPTPETDP